MAPLRRAVASLVLIFGMLTATAAAKLNFEERLFVAPEIKRVGIFFDGPAGDNTQYDGVSEYLQGHDIKDVVIRTELSVKWSPGFEGTKTAGKAQLTILDVDNFVLTTINADTLTVPSARAISCPTVPPSVVFADSYGVPGDVGPTSGLEEGRRLDYTILVTGTAGLAYQWKFVIINAKVPALPSPDFYGLSSPIHVDSSFFSLFFFDYTAEYAKKDLWLRVGLAKISQKEAETRFQDDRNAGVDFGDPVIDDCTVDIPGCPQYCAVNPGDMYCPGTVAPPDPSATPDYDLPDDFYFDDPYYDYYDEDDPTFNTPIVDDGSFGKFSQPVNPFSDAVLLVHRSDSKECPILNNPLSGGTPWVHMSFETTTVLTISPKSQPALKAGRYFIAVSGGGRVASTYELELEVFEPNQGLSTAILVAFLLPLTFGIVLLCLCHSPVAPCCFTNGDPLTRGYHIAKCSEVLDIAKFQFSGPVVPNDEFALPEHEQDDIPDAPINQKYHWSFPWFIFSIAAIFGVTAFQVVTSRYQLMRQSGDRDLCFYNELCYHPLPFWDVPFNNILSNSVYIIAGLVMLAHVFTYNVGLMKTSGLSILYAQGWALVAVGWNSAVYHICPSPSAFQFDTAFMFVTAMLISLACYQAGERLSHRFADTPRMDGVKSGKFVVFYLVPIFVFNYIGTRLISTPEDVVKPVFAVFVAAWEVALFFYVWKRYDEPTSFMRDHTTKPSQQKTPPAVFGGFIDAIWCMCVGTSGAAGYWFLCLVVVAASSYAIFTDGVDLATSFLGMNLLISVVAMVRVGASRLAVATQNKVWGYARIRWAKFLVCLMAVLWVVAFSFFKLGTSNKSATPAKSRSANTGCVLFGYMDNHDAWHLLGGLALLTQMCLIIFLNPPHEFTDYVKLTQSDTKDIEAGGEAESAAVTRESAPLVAAESAGADDGAIELAATSS